MCGCITAILRCPFPPAGASAVHSEIPVTPVHASSDLSVHEFQNITFIDAARINLSFHSMTYLLQNTGHLYGFNVSSCELGLSGVEHTHCCVSGNYNLSAAHSF